MIKFALSAACRESGSFIDLFAVSAPTAELAVAKGREMISSRGRELIVPGSIQARLSADNKMVA